MEPEAVTVSRRHVLGGALASAGLVLAAPALTAAARAEPAAPAVTAGVPSRNRGFVQRSGNRFVLNGATFRFGGTNCYYLHQKSHYAIDAVLDDAAAMGLTVIRAWAFADGPDNDHPLQPRPGVYDEAAFDSLDYAVWKAGQLGIRLVLPLVNNWPDYGGMQQYVSWFLGLPDDSYGAALNHDRFYTDVNIRACYRAYAQHVITRRNRYTGLAYHTDPTIMTFELANEPRNRSDRTGATVLAWITEMSAWIRKLAPRQLVAVGDEGFYGDASQQDYPYSDYEGGTWLESLRSPTIDYGTVHVYPQAWGETSASKPGTDAVTWGTRWIRKHLSDGAVVGKPVVVEEYGLRIDPAGDVADTAARDAAYRAWTREVERNGAGDQFWLLTSRVDDGSYYGDYDGFRVVWRDDDTNPTASTAILLAQHAARMAAAH